MDDQTTAEGLRPPRTPRDPDASQPVLNRRTVLAAAATAGAGVAAARLLALANEPAFERVPVTGTQGNKTGLDWVAPLGNEAARVSHLLRRFTFGATAEELERAQSDGYTRTVERLVETKIAEPPVLAGADEASQENPLSPGALQQWWIDWMLASPTPFGERITLFWHGHFTSDFRKVGNQFPYLYWQNLTWRRNALADLGTMLYQVTIDPAMLRYLDLGSSTAQNPNENYSRELMELFTMGPDAFNEADVRAGAKALSGWREPRTQTMIDADIKRQQARTGQPPRQIPKADTAKTGIYEVQRGYRSTPPSPSATGPWCAWSRGRGRAWARCCSIRRAWAGGPRTNRGCRRTRCSRARTSSRPRYRRCGSSRPRETRTTRTSTA